MAKGWDIDPAIFAEKVEEQVNTYARYMASQILTEVVRMSPVDTGRFRNNNLVSIGSADYGRTDSDKGAKLPKGSTHGVGSYDDGMMMLQSNTQRIKYPVIYIQNNLPYAESLENGHSQQAPSGVYANAFHGVSQLYK